MSLIADVLNAAGVPNRETRYQRPPSGAYAVYMDEIDTDGPDGMNMIYRHGATIELYSSARAPLSEAAIEEQLDLKGLRWSKQSAYWIQEEQLYQVVYEFNYIEKGGLTYA